uniref:C2 domain-containing protein n=1 Tax=Chromera velia CCMP2878 TaxID=1169474 RepID=A0A0G4HP99_9ALVE|eukprot:Cvel_7748.t1-p1 / transcript=Cvel_7748.t1 / gene=Cvel_7748 / organism=Chromera_velia_CCMP2878 / gene_product=C2 domain-containing protein At1g63220, putative / transcript_product=C2 domain-containing protein At1g63220, putative / location=Cvel_scaffold412:68318-71411(-) / protein_length=242 / sequence_SO=supercontig / SO=protein_coding / is_pseudo=false
MAYFSSLVITAHSARDLHNTEWMGKMDPYCKIICGSQIARTNTHRNAHKSPVWNQRCSIRYSGEPTIRFEVWDADTFTHDDFIGSVNMTLGPLLSSNPPRFQGELALVRDQGTGAGMIFVSVEAQAGAPPAPAPSAPSAPPAYNPASGYVPPEEKAKYGGGSSVSAGAAGTGMFAAAMAGLGKVIEAAADSSHKKKKKKGGGAKKYKGGGKKKRGSGGHGSFSDYSVSDFFSDVESFFSGSS